MDTGRGLKVVVVGATGNLGTGIVEALGREPDVAEIVGVARRPTEWTSPKATFTVADTTTDDFRPIVRGADAGGERTAVGHDPGCPGLAAARR